MNDDLRRRISEHEGPRFYRIEPTARDLEIQKEVDGYIDDALRNDLRGLYASACAKWKKLGNVQIRTSYGLAIAWVVQAFGHDPPMQWCGPAIDDNSGGIDLVESEANEFFAGREGYVAMILEQVLDNAIETAAEVEELR